MTKKGKEIQKHFDELEEEFFPKFRITLGISGSGD